MCFCWVVKQNRMPEATSSFLKVQFMGSTCFLYFRVFFSCFWNCSMVFVTPLFFYSCQPLSFLPYPKKILHFLTMSKSPFQQYVKIFCLVISIFSIPLCHYIDWHPISKHANHFLFRVRFLSFVSLWQFHHNFRLEFVRLENFWKKFLTNTHHFNTNFHPQALVWIPRMFSTLFIKLPKSKHFQKTFASPTFELGRKFIFVSSTSICNQTPTFRERQNFFVVYPENM